MFTFKRLTILLLCLFLFFTGVYSFRQYQAFKPCLKSQNAQTTLACLNQLPQIKKRLITLQKIYPFPKVSQAINLVNALEPFLPHQDILLGLNHPTKYLILLQNDTELRANGGFAGSYATLTLDSLKPTFTFQDIYVPDGQLFGHVEPPLPIQQAFGQGWFKLRDADWEPSFPVASTTIRWFFQKGKEINPDILLTLSLSAIKDILKITGPLEVKDFNLILNQENLYLTLQNLVERNFFPGSTQKKDTLTATGHALVQKLSSLTFSQKLSIANILIENLKNQNILLNAQNQALQNLFLSQNYAGKLHPSECQETPPCLNDSLAIIETNLGANKANQYIKRQTTHTITKNLLHLVHHIQIEYKNDSSYENPKPPETYGGNYLNYLRVYLPQNAQNIKVTASPTLPSTRLERITPLSQNSPENFTKDDKYGFRVLGFFHPTKASTQSQVSISYELLLENPTNYQLTILKQHGLKQSPQTIILPNQTLTTNLNTDFTHQESL